MQRSFEREIIPMARSLGLALAPWSVLAGGKLRTDAEEKRRLETGEGGWKRFGSDWKRTEEEAKMSRALEKVAQELGAKSISSGKPSYWYWRSLAKL
jgi:aryl-alcohol dehydrogenase-like predicted oxidoreductase